MPRVSLRMTKIDLSMFGDLLRAIHCYEVFLTYLGLNKLYNNVIIISKSDFAVGIAHARCQCFGNIPAAPAAGLAASFVPLLGYEDRTMIFQSNSKDSHLFLTL